MAPIEPDLSNSNLKPLAIFIGYLVNAIGVTAFLAYVVLYGSYRSLSPTQATRFRVSNRKKHVRIFLAMATISLGVTWYHMFSFFLLSYQSWAHEMGEAIPRYFFGDGGVLGKDATVQLALGRWLKDTSLFEQTWEIATESSRRYWWSQQIFLGAAAWSVFLGVEGRRRQIPHLWVFMLLAQTVAVSFAMNLFFIAILLAPLGSPRDTTTMLGSWLSKIRPLPSAISGRFSMLRSKTIDYSPHPALYLLPLSACYIAIFLLPFTTFTPSFMTTLLIPHLLLFQTLYADRSLLAFLDGMRGDRSLRMIFRFMGYVSLALYLKQTIVALMDNDPGARTHRHAALFEYLRLPGAEEHGPMSRSGTALTRVLGSLSDHPAVATVSWDVLLCGLSLVVWASIRGLDVLVITGNAGLNKISEQVRNPGREIVSSGNVKEKGKRTGKSVEQGSRRKRASISNPIDETYIDSVPSLRPGQAPKGEIEKEENAEAGAVSWALLLCGGLGMVAAGVLGAETERL